MKTIIAGGRDYTLSPEDIEWLGTLGITEVISGGARGADRGGEQWALDKGLPLTIISAEWMKHGLAAGPVRNKKMAEYAEAVVLFPGGKGTESMRKEAEIMYLPIFEAVQV